MIARDHCHTHWYTGVHAADAGIPPDVHHCNRWRADHPGDHLCCCGTTRPRDKATDRLAAVLLDHDAQVRAQVAEEIAQAIEAQADAYNERIAQLAGVPPRGRDGMVSHGIRRAAAIARQHATTAEGDHHV